MHPPPHCPRIGQGRLRVALAIDQLQHPEDFAFPVFHRQGNQRTRVVAGLLIEFRIEAKRPRFRYAVRVGQFNHLAVERAISGHRIFRQWKRVFAERKLHAVVLRQLETQLRIAQAFLRGSPASLHEI